MANPPGPAPPPPPQPSGRKLLADGGQAFGLTLAFSGGVSIIKGLHVIENGSFQFDSLVHTQFGGDPAQVSVMDGGVDLRCDSGWVINGFQLGSATRLDVDPPGPKWPDPDAASPTLSARVQAVAETIRQQARTGDVLLLGSTDPKTWGAGAAGNNVGLAMARANDVAGLLRTQLSGRHVQVANEQITGGAASGPAADGLARAVFGVKESSDRSVRVCVLEPRPHTIKMTTGAGTSASLDFLGGVVTLFAAVILGLIVLAVIGGRGARPSTDRRSSGETDARASTRSDSAMDGG
jgi:hypothetical protein